MSASTTIRNRKLQSLKNELERATEEETKLVHKREDIIQQLEQKRSKLDYMQQHLKALEDGYEELKAKFEDIEKEKLLELNESLRKKQQEVVALNEKAIARERALKDLKAKKQKHDQLCEREKRMQRQLELLMLAKNNATISNYKAFLNTKRIHFPMDGSEEEKIEWLESFGAFIEFISNGNM